MPCKEIAEFSGHIYDSNSRIGDEMHENFMTLGQSANGARNTKHELDGCEGFGLWVGAAVEHNTNLKKLRCPIAAPRPPVPAAVPWVPVTHRTVAGIGLSMITALRKRLAQLEPARQTTTLLALATPAPPVAALQLECTPGNIWVIHCQKHLDEAVHCKVAWRGGLDCGEVWIHTGC
jgi:hypothetical protein